MLDAFFLKLKLRMINIWPPFLFSGIWVSYPDSNLRTVVVSLRDYFLNRNAQGTHYGGSLFSMTDPFYALILMNALGPKYIVWDKSAEIQFLKPGRKLVRAEFHIPEEEIEKIRITLETERKVEPVFDATVVDLEGTVVCKVKKVLYVRKRA
ncbi:MAG: DUF4442 domain-containing protein [Xanthomonadaceae bacterium]|nr:DUF4442 domain-containing protein [Xanthomonadaceae bacterium]